jgi:hypothetical protein
MPQWLLPTSTPSKSGFLNRIDVEIVTTRNLEWQHGLPGPQVSQARRRETFARFR